MKNKIILIVILLILTTFVICACSNNETQKEEPLKEFNNVSFNDLIVEHDGNVHKIEVIGAPVGTTIKYDNNEKIAPGDYVATAVLSKEGYVDKTLTANLSILPSAELIVNSRALAKQSVEQNYDFKLNLNGELTLFGISQNANANYEAKYRYNSSTQDLKFVRETSGLLLPDSKSYIMNSGNNKINIKVDPDTNDLKKISVVSQEEEGLTLLNIPFAAIIDALTKKNIIDIQKNQDGDNRYKYSATLKMDTENALINKVLGVIGGLGTSVEIKDVTLSNPVNGIKLYFNYKNENEKFMDFKFSAEVGFPLKGIGVKLRLTYEQFANNENFVLPNVDGFTLDANVIQATINEINSSFEDIKNDDTYSIGLEAVNEFDPGWNKKAVKDYYNGLLYKNTVINGETSRVDFNHSYEYKAHTEEDGAETFKYTIGNLQNGEVYLVSRKGTNQETLINDKNLDTQFDYLFNAARLQAADVDCIKKNVENNKVFYELFLTKTATINVQNKILEIVNSNDAPGVIDVDNYFNSEEYSIEESSIEVVVVDGKLESINVNTELKYSPTNGEYVDQVITLNNSINLNINEWFSYAVDYNAPSSTGSIVGLKNFKYYIL